MATAKTEKIENKEEKRRIYVDRDTSDNDPNMYVAINGRSFLLPRGKYVEVPVYVADFIESCKRAQHRYDETIDRLSQMAK